MVFCLWEHFSAVQKVDFRDLLTISISLTGKGVKPRSTLRDVGVTWLFYLMGFSG